MWCRAGFILHELSVRGKVSQSKQLVEHCFLTRKELLGLYDEEAVSHIIHDKRARGEYRCGLRW